MSGREIIPTHSAYLELRDERAGMQEGYRFLDEKRLILAAEILATLRDYEDTLSTYRDRQCAAQEAIRAALGRHGFEELGVYPSAPAPECGVSGESRSVLGVRVEAVPALPPNGTGSAATQTGADPQGPSVMQSPEAERCRACFARLIPVASRLAVLTGNLERLRAEYVRTARRARALEDVLLPEVEESLTVVEVALEELEREEAVRVRHAKR